MKLRTLLGTAALILLPLAASAQQPVADGVALVGPGKFAGVFEEKTTSTVESIDAASRSVVLVRANGDKIKVVAGEQV